MRRVGRAVKPHRAHGGERAEGRGHPAARQLPTLTSAPRPSRQSGAGGARRRGGGMAWARRGRPRSPGTAASAAASVLGAADTVSGGTGYHGTWGHSPAMSPPQPCCPQISPVPFSAPRSPSARTNTLCHPKDCLSPPVTQCPQSPFAHFSHYKLFLSVPIQPNVLIAPNASIPQISNSLPRSISQPSILPEIPPSLYHPPNSTISPLHPNTLCHPNTPYSFQASPGDTPFVIVGSPISGRSRGVRVPTHGTPGGGGGRAGR